MAFILVALFLCHVGVGVALKVHTVHTYAHQYGTHCLVCKNWLMNAVPQVAGNLCVWWVGLM